MKNIIEICKNINEVLEQHNIKKYDFMIKSFPHSFILTIPVINLKQLQVEHMSYMFKKLESDVSNGYDGFQVETKETDSYIFFSGMLL